MKKLISIWLLTLAAFTTQAQTFIENGLANPTFTDTDTSTRELRRKYDPINHRNSGLWAIRLGKDSTQLSLTPAGVRLIQKDSNTVIRAAIATKMTGSLASDAETQLATNSGISEDSKVVSRLKLINWWTWARSQNWTWPGSNTFGNVTLAAPVIISGVPSTTTSNFTLLARDITSGEMKKVVSTTFEPSANKSTSVAPGTSDILFPTQKAVYDFVTAGLATKQATLPSQTSNSGKVLQTDGTNPVWMTPFSLPSQTSNSGKVLQTDGTNPSWTTPFSLPTQTGNSGKHLQTDGTNASWVTAFYPPTQTGNSGKVLQTDGTNPTWVSPFSLPSQTSNSGKVLQTDGTNPSWVAPFSLPTQTGNSGKHLQTDGTNPSWVPAFSLPTQTGNSGKVLQTDGTNPSWVTPSSGGNSNDVLGRDAAFNGILLATDPTNTVIGATKQPGTGQMEISRVIAPYTGSVTKVFFIITGTAGSGLSGTGGNGIGIYDASWNRLGWANCTSTFAGTGTLSASLDQTVNLTAGVEYKIALVSTGTTRPNFRAVAQGFATNIGIASEPYRFQTKTSTTLDTSLSPTGWTATTADRVWVGLGN